MFDPTGDEVPDGSAARERDGAGGESDGLAAQDRAWEANGAWAERDWSAVPVVARSEDPPAGWVPETGWLDEIECPELGPVAWFEQITPSGRLMSELENMPPDLVDTDADAVEMVAHWARLESYCALQKRRSAAALARRTVMAEGLARLDDLGVRSHHPNIAGDELSLRLGIGRCAARTLVRSGWAVDAAGIPTGDALAAGEIDAAKADLIIAGIEDLEPDAALEVQERLLARAPHLPTGRLRRELAAARAAVHPQHFDERCKQAAAARRVDQPRPLPDGMASLYAVLPAVEAIQLYRAVDTAARSAKTAGDVRTLDQLRADALALMGTAAVQTGWIGICPRSHVDDVPDASRGPDPSGAVGTTRPFGSEARGEARAAPRDGPDEGGAGPDEGGAAPDDRLDDGGAGPDDGGAGPDDGGAGPDDGGAGPDDGGAGPDDGGAAPGDRPDVSGGRPGQGCGMRVGVLGGRSAHVRVVVPLTTMMGGEGGPAEDLEGAEAPAHLEGYGPISAAVARALAAGGPWARMVTDPVDRTVLEVSADRYQPTAAMADLVRAREPECVHLTCSTSSDRCDLHHRIPWPIGPTAVTNLDPGCRRDHLLVTHGGWSYRVDDRGRRTWTTPTGLTYVEEPDGSITLRKPGRPPRHHDATLDDPGDSDRPGHGDPDSNLPAAHRPDDDGPGGGAPDSDAPDDHAPDDHAPNGRGQPDDDAPVSTWPIDVDTPPPF